MQIQQLYPSFRPSLLINIAQIYLPLSQIQICLFV